MKIKYFLNGLKRGFHIFGENLIMLFNSILLSFVYLFGVGTTSLISKIFRKRFLDINISKKEKTYWSNLDIKKKPIEDYYRMF